MAVGRVVAANVNRTVWERWFCAGRVAVVVMCFGPTLTIAQAANQSRTNDTALAQQPGITQQSAARTAEQSPAHKYFTDVVLVNQDGEKMRFFSDLIQGKVVVISSFFGTCQASCLPINHNLEKVQQALGDKMDKDVRIISITVDPTVDTPASLKEYAKRLNAKPGRYFLTGDKQNVDLALTKLGQFVEDKQNHLNVIIIGNERTGLWKKAFGLARSDELIKVVESVLNDESPRNK